MEEPRVLKSAMSSLCRALIPDVLPAVMPDVPAVPEFLPAPPPPLVLPSRLPADLPAEGRAALAAALQGPLPAAKAPGRGELVREAVPCRWDDEEIARLRGFLATVDDLRGRQGRVYPLEYLLALLLAAGMAGDGGLDAAAEWAATAPGELLLRLGAPRDRDGKPRRPDAGTIRRGLAGCDQGQYDDVLCGWQGARARALQPGMRRHLRIDGKALRGAAPRGGHAPMLLSGIWDDGTTAAQLPVDTVKTNEIPVFRQLLGKIPEEDLEGAVISADQMHTQRKHARKISAAGAFFIFTIGENQPRLFGAADALPWGSIAGEAWTVDRGHGRIDVRTIKTLPPTERILARWPEVKQVFLVERYSYGTDGELLGAVAVLGITSLPADQAGPADLLAYLRGHWSIEMHHYVRDVVLGEDASRTRSAYRAMAAVRNAVAGILRLHQVPNIAAQLRANHRDPYQLPMQLLGLMTPLAPNGNPPVT
jgi:predicted transposase YbfD/YdcC